MAWEWVAPLATGLTGTFAAFFTWRTHIDGKRQVQRLADDTLQKERQQKLYAEQRSAYVAALHVMEIDLRRRRYRREGQLEKLAEVETTWSKSERVRMTNDAKIAIRLFGSEAASVLTEKWTEAITLENEEAMQKVADEFAELASKELQNLDAR